MSAATLPLPIRFDLPGPEWTPTDPGSLGVPDAAFLAVRDVPAGDYVPIISVKGEQNDGPLEPMADALVMKLEGAAEELELVSRRSSGDAEAPALAQVVGFTVVSEGQRYDLRQSHVLVGYVDVNTGRQIVLAHTLTCTFAQSEQVAPEFNDYVKSVRVVTDADGNVVDPTDQPDAR